MERDIRWENVEASITPFKYLDGNYLQLSFRVTHNENVFHIHHSLNVNNKEYPNILLDIMVLWIDVALDREEAYIAQGTEASPAESDREAQ